MAESLPDLRRVAGVLFDLDGVLTPTAEVHMRAWQKVFDDVLSGFDVAVYTDADYFAHVDGRKRYDGVAAVLRSRNIELPWGSPEDAAGSDTVCAIGNRKNDAFAAELREHGVAPYPGSLALVRMLRERGVPLAVVSSSKNAGAVLAASGLTDSFEAVVDGVVAERDGLPSKPAPDMFLAGARALGLAAAECAAFEDAIAGVASASAAGCALVVGVDRGVGADALRAAGAHFIVTDLDEFSAQFEQEAS